jgi:hypothetical protein
VWFLEVVQRYGEYTYRQGEIRGIVGKERIGKEMDGYHLTPRTHSTTCPIGWDAQRTTLR